MSAYRKGKRFEYWVRNYLIGRGQIVYSTAGSSGTITKQSFPVDLISFDGDKAYLHECKNQETYNQNELAKTYKLMRELSVETGMPCLIWLKNPRKNPTINMFDHGKIATCIWRI